MASTKRLMTVMTVLFRKLKFKQSVSSKIFQECCANPYIRITKHKSDCLPRGQWQVKANAPQTAIERLLKHWMHAACEYLPSACPQCKSAEGKVKLTLQYSLAQRVALQTDVLVHGDCAAVKERNCKVEYFLVMKTASNCWMSVFCCPTRV